ncbi:MAG: GNAT family N-acetyltransferase [Peptococcaceae bacterium]|nr:GNAT family N-acetyltransferase [Peptococcaceae bacterium]
MFRRQLTTAKGIVELIAGVGPDLLADLSLDSGLDSFRPADRQHLALIQIAGMPGGIVTIALDGKNVLGYVSFYCSDRDNRRIVELGGIEVTLPWRRLGLASWLLRTSFDRHLLEHCIIYLTGKSCHWDLEGNNLNMWRYQHVLIKLFESAGFVRKLLDGPGTTLNPADFFMIRIGRNVPADQVMLFERMYPIKDFTPEGPGYGPG